MQNVMILNILVFQKAHKRGKKHSARVQSCFILDLQIYFSDVRETEYNLEFKI